MAYYDEFLRIHNPRVPGIQRTQGTVSKMAMPTRSGMMGTLTPSSAAHMAPGGPPPPSGPWSTGYLRSLPGRSGGSTWAPGTRASFSPWMVGSSGAVKRGAGDRNISDAMYMAANQRNPWEEEEDWLKGQQGGMTQGGYRGFS